MKIRKCKYNFGNNNDGVFSTINGYATETNNFGETAVGILNKSTLDPDTFTSPDVVTSSKATLFSVGNGSDNVRKNAFEIKANGDTYINGVGGYDGTNSEDATSVGESIQSVQDSSNKVAEDIESIHIEKSGIGNTYVLKVAGEDRGTITDESGVSFTPGDGLQLVDTDLSVKIDSTSESYLTAGQDGLKISGIDAKFGDYLPLSGGEMTGAITYGKTRINDGDIRVNSSVRNATCQFAPMGLFATDDNNAVALLSYTLNDWQGGNTAYRGLTIKGDDGITRYGENGVTIPDKTTSDLLNAAGSTTPISNIVTQVQAAIVDSAPETLDTLNELAAALGDDPNFATTITTQLGNKLDTSTYNSDKATFALKSELPDMSNYALKSELNFWELNTEIESSFNNKKIRVFGINNRTERRVVSLNTQLSTGSNQVRIVNSIDDDDVFKISGDANIPFLYTFGNTDDGVYGSPTILLCSDSYSQNFTGGGDTGLYMCIDKGWYNMDKSHGIRYGIDGVTIYGKTANDLLNARGGTTTLKTLGGESILGTGNFDVATEEDIQALFN